MVGAGQAYWPKEITTPFAIVYRKKQLFVLVPQQAPIGHETVNHAVPIYTIYTYIYIYIYIYMCTSLTKCVL